MRHLIIALLTLLILSPTQAQFTCPGSAPTRLDVNDRVMVLPEAGINLRSTPGASSTIQAIIPGETILRISDGPVCSEGYTWWQIDWQSTRGWVAESYDETTYWLEPVVIIEAENNNLRLSVPGALATDVQSVTMQALVDDESPNFNSPTGQQFILEGYPYPGTQPTITAYNAAAIRSTIPGANAILDALRNTLDNRPPETDLLLLPRLPVTIDVVTQVSYIDFIDGIGVRALIVLSPGREEPQPPTQSNQSFVYYLFQGLNNDNTTYVQALLPLPSDLLPADAPDYDPVDPQASQQLADLRESLRQTLSQASLSPDISVYDRMMASLYTSATPAPMSVTTERYTYGDALTLDYPVSLAEGIELDVLNPSPERQMPRYLEMSLINYPVIDFVHPPLLRVFRTADIQLARNEPAVNTVNTLSNALLTKPETIPDLMLPMFDSPLQSPLGNLEYVRFRSGNGVFYLAAMVEENGAVHSRDLLYVFQGMTNDNEFYIQGLFPVSSDAFNQPVVNAQATVAPLTDRDYTPNLALLRQMMASLDIKTR